MTPFLFNSDHSGSFTGNGIGTLSGAVSCSTTHQLNGEDELRMEYPVSGALFESLVLRNIIVAQVEKRGRQPYRIYRITKPLNGVVTVYARHLVYDLAGIVVKPFTAADIQTALAGMSTNAMTANPFTFSTTRSTAAAFKVTVPGSVWSLMAGKQGSLLDVYGGEYAFDNWTVRLENRIGVDSGVSVRYGVNMTDLEQDANCADCYTGVVAYWQNDNKVVYSEVQNASGIYGYTKVLTVDMSQQWEDAPSVSDLNTAAAVYITANKIGVPKIAWKIGFIPLAQTEEYKDVAILEQVGLGDTVSVRFERLGVDDSARVNAIEWDVLLERYISVSLGSVRSNIADTVAQQTREVAQMPTQIRTISERIASDILGANGGSVRLLDTNGDGHPDELYIADNPDPAQAQKVWRFNYEGWAASSNGYNGPFTLGASIGSGITADFITAGVLNAALIQIISQGAVGSGFGDCSIKINDQFLQGNQLSTSNLTFKLGSQVDTTPGFEALYGDLKLYPISPSGEAIPFNKDHPFLWAGGIQGSCGLVLYDPYYNGTTNKAHIGICYAPDLGMLIDIADPDGRDAFHIFETGDMYLRGALRCKSLLVDGKAAVTKTVIGYYVYGASGTYNAGIFIPKGVSGNFQIASNDWYSGFSFDGNGGATYASGTQVTYTVKTVYNDGTTSS